MNYTDKYHLPQWKKEDRIMMEDFNSAMASIERGLAAADVAGALADSMSRDVYRQVAGQRVHHAAGGLADAMWVNALESLEEAGGEGHGWNGRYGVYHGNGGLPTMAGIKALEPKEEAKINTGAADPAYFKDRAAVTFTSDGYGTLDEVQVWSRRASNSYTSADFTITMTRLDTNEIVAVSDPFTQPDKSDAGWYWLRLGLPLEPHVSYRLEMKITNQNGFRGWAGFMLGTTEYVTNVDSLRFTAREAEPVVIKTVTPPAWAVGAIAILRWEGDGSAALAINGQALTSTRTRQGVNAVGGSCKETEFEAEHIPAEPFELALTMEKGSGDLNIYDYGLIWR